MVMPAPAVTMRRGPSRIRLLAFNALAGFLGLASCAFGFLSIVWGLEAERTVHRLHDIGPGLILAVMIAPAALALPGARPRSIAGMQQLVAVVLGWTIAGALSHALDGFVGMFLLVTALLVVLHPGRDRLVRLPRRPSWVMGLIAFAAAVPLMRYALNEAALQRWTVPTNPHAAEAHYRGMAAMALAMILVTLVAASRTDGWRLPAWCVGLASAVFGIVSLDTPYLEGSFGTIGGVLAVLGGLAFVAAAEFEARRESRGERPSGTSRRPLDRLV